MSVNHEQAEYWSSQTSWVIAQDAMDACLAPVLDGLIARADLQPGTDVLDIGCGTGASLLAARQRVGPDGHVCGADIAKPLLDVAQKRVAQFDNVTTVLADAQSDEIGSGYEAMISRFGVMFFQDTTAAFANIARALKPGGQITMAAWADARQNPFFMGAARTVQSVLGPMPKVDRRLPGPFAFEDIEHTHAMLKAAGLAEISFDTCALDLTPSGTLEDFADLCMYIGPAASGIAHHKASGDALADLKAALVETYRPMENADGVRVPALIHFISATANAG